MRIMLFNLVLISGSVIVLLGAFSLLFSINNYTKLVYSSRFILIGCIVIALAKIVRETAVLPLMEPLIFGFLVVLCITMNAMVIHEMIEPNVHYTKKAANEISKT